MRKSFILIILLSSIVSLAQQTGTITDARDGKTYKTVVIGTQTWMAENLNVSTFRNGDTIPEVKSKEEWEKAGDEGKPAWCYYDNDTANGRIYGKLYNWYVVIDKRGLALAGFHIPTDAEWTILENNLGEGAGTKMKTEPIYETKISYVDEGGFYETKWVPCNNCSYWTEKQKANNPCTACRNQRGKEIKTGKYIPKTKRKIEEKNTIGGWNGTNESRFSGLPGGYRYSMGMYEYISSYGSWWSSSEYDADYAWDRYLGYDDGSVDRYSGSKNYGFSVRCLKDK
jgi:uncharacterized protein (TIGR02145 family)